MGGMVSSDTSVTLKAGNTTWADRKNTVNKDILATSRTGNTPQAKWYHFGNSQGGKRHLGRGGNAINSDTLLTPRAQDGGEEHGK